MDLNNILNIVKTAATFAPEFEALFNEVLKGFSEKDQGTLRDAYNASWQRAQEQHRAAQEL